MEVNKPGFAGWQFDKHFRSLRSRRTSLSGESGIRWSKEFGLTSSPTCCARLEMFVSNAGASIRPLASLRRDGMIPSGLLSFGLLSSVNFGPPSRIIRLEARGSRVVGPSVDLRRCATRFCDRLLFLITYLILSRIKYQRNEAVARDFILDRLRADFPETRDP